MFLRQRLTGRRPSARAEGVQLSLPQQPAPRIKAKANDYPKEALRL
jgi:hypothetical protein